jgi:tRNA(Ser,Leu) C12 N-acetylase TAN1
MKHQFTSNIKCQACIDKVKPILDVYPSIQMWHVDLQDPKKILTIEVLDHLDSSQLQEALKKIGYTIQPA